MKRFAVLMVLIVVMILILPMMSACQLTELQGVKQDLATCRLELQGKEMYILHQSCIINDLEWTDEELVAIEDFCKFATNLCDLYPDATVCGGEE
jgi:hypothetical protein